VLHLDKNVVISGTWLFISLWWYGRQHVEFYYKTMLLF